MNYFKISALILLLTCNYSIGDFACNSSPCQNGGECFQPDGWSSEYRCLCSENFAGKHCTLPFPTVTCGDKSIEIIIDQRIVEEEKNDVRSELVHFKDSPVCSALLRNGRYYLKVNAPFVGCGMILKRITQGYSFGQQIVWNKVGAAVERPLVLLDFKCNYTDHYVVGTGPLVPKTIAVDFQTSYGRFTVQMTLYRNKTFSPTTRLNTRPVVTIDQQVCVDQSLINVAPKHLVLTSLRCWMTRHRNGSGQTYDLLSSKCSAADTVEVLSNGNSSSARFCFRMFKWKNTMSALYLHCYVSVCNKTAFPDECRCSNGRNKRSSEIIQQLEMDGVRISSNQIRIVKENELGDWLSYLNSPADTTSQVFENDPDDASGNRTITNHVNSKSDSTVSIVIGVVLVLSVVVLGVILGVCVTRRRSRRRHQKISRKTDQSTNGHQPRVLPSA